MFQELPRRMGRTLWFDASELGGEILEHIVEGHVRIAAVQQSHNLFSHRIIHGFSASKKVQGTEVYIPFVSFCAL